MKALRNMETFNTINLQVGYSYLVPFYNLAIIFTSRELLNTVRPELSGGGNYVIFPRNPKNLRNFQKIL